MQRRCKPDALNPSGFIFLTNAPHKPVEMREIGNIGKVLRSTRQENAHWAMALEKHEAPMGWGINRPVRRASGPCKAAGHAP